MYLGMVGEGKVSPTLASNSQRLTLGDLLAGEIPLSWFPLHPITMPSFLHLHLTGLSYSPSFFKSLRAPHLRSLTIEDFDSASGEPLLASLRDKELFTQLRELRVVEHESGWAELREEIEQWCAEREVKLVASWKMRRLDRRW